MIQEDSEFDDAQFTPDELGVIKRMLPAHCYEQARISKRGNFFRYLWSRASKSEKKMAAPLRNMMYRNALSKRTAEKPLSQRKVVTDVTLP